MIDTKVQLNITTNEVSYRQHAENHRPTDQQADRAEHRRFFLHATRIGQNKRSGGLQSDEI